jgi:hypothetical protein
MEDESKTHIDHPEKLCDAIVALIDELEEGGLIEEERASELRSEVYLSINTSNDQSE